MRVNHPTERVETFLVYHVNKNLCVVVAPGREPSDYLGLAEFGVDGCEEGGAFMCSELAGDQTIPCLRVDAGGAWNWC